jgi:hypothetical protein
MLKLRNILLLFSIIIAGCSNAEKEPIDRYELVSRHNPTVNSPDKLSSFTVGNGELAFTADFTGLQTFPGFYDDKSVPLGTQSHWGWHTIPSDEDYKLAQAFQSYDTYGRQVNYASETGNDAASWLRANPHRLHLGQVGFRLTKTDGSVAAIDDISNIEQTLNLWQGILYSSFQFDNEAVDVETGCHPQRDEIAAVFRTPLIDKQQIAVLFRFPYGSLSWGKQTADWQSPDRHSSVIADSGDGFVVIQRVLDNDGYFVRIQWQGAAQFTETGPHDFLLTPAGGQEFSFTCSFSSERTAERSAAAVQSLQDSRGHWQNYWQSGGAVDLSGSSDPRAAELERRIVLSQYLLAVQCAGSLPPQETGLTCNSWHGKFHLEMHWWHGVHFPLWGRPQQFARSLGWYSKILPVARGTAEMQGYKGARWPKMTSPGGRESPSGVGVFLIWQQPHPIYYAELLYRSHPGKSVLEKYREVVFATAEFMASYAHHDSDNDRYVLGPPLIPAQEIYKPETTINPAFELSYWRFGLQTAQKWRERLGLSRVDKWDEVIMKLSDLPQNDGLYQNTENALDTFTDAWNRNDHPTLLGAFGMLPNDEVDSQAMRRTLKEVMKSWNWQRTWGWDYPLVAMTAARVGEPELAIDALLMDVQKNTYLNNGHNYQDDRLTLYLPGNGGLLTAVAMMAAGWDGAPGNNAPGFPNNQKWVVRWEGIRPLP